MRLCALAAFLSLAAVPVAAQDFGYRGWLGTTVQAVELRPVARAADDCIPGVACYLPLDEEVSVAGTQDLSLTLWGFGVRGLSATVYLRGRTALGSDFAWPRSGDHFDALVGYAQWIRGGWTVRAGRQEIRSGLGFSGFDGALGGWRTRRLEVEAFAGRSLARGLRAPANEALAGLDDFLPDESAYLFGGSVRGELGATSGTVRYQREILADRSALVTERASFDGSAAFPGVHVTGGIDWDFGRGQAGKGHLTAAAPLDEGRWTVSASAKRYVPYFTLSTIWGFFEPVAYHEIVGRVGWNATPSVAVWASSGWRHYGDTETTVVLEPLQDTGWRIEAGGAWVLSAAWTVNGEYNLESGPGGFLNSGDASVRWSPGPRFGASLSAMTFQQIEQYRIGDGRAFGGGLTLDATLLPRVTVVTGASVIRHYRPGDGIGGAWNQARGWASLRWTIGGDAGRANATRMRR